MLFQPVITPECSLRHMGVGYKCEQGVSHNRTTASRHNNDWRFYEKGKESCFRLNFRIAMLIYILEIILVSPSHHTCTHVG